MISDKEQANIRSNYPVPEWALTPLERLIAKEEPLAFVPLDAEISVFLADFSMRFPEKWQTVKERIRDSRSSIREISWRLGISPSTAIRHLDDLRTEAKNYYKKAE